MPFLVQLIGGFLIITGAPMLVAGIFTLSQSLSTGSNLAGNVGALVFIGAWSVTGAFMVRSGRSGQRRQAEKKLLAIFFSLLRQNKGRITPMTLAAESGLNGAEARKFLDARSAEFNGCFEVDLDGGVIYRFPTSELPPERI